MIARSEALRSWSTGAMRAKGPAPALFYVAKRNTQRPQDPVDERFDLGHLGEYCRQSACCPPRTRHAPADLLDRRAAPEGFGKQHALARQDSSAAPGVEAVRSSGSRHVGSWCAIRGLADRRVREAASRALPAEAEAAELTRTTERFLHSRRERRAGAGWPCSHPHRRTENRERRRRCRPLRFLPPSREATG